jgi:hypothetical protein
MNLSSVQPTGFAQLTAQPHVQPHMQSLEQLAVQPRIQPLELPALQAHQQAHVQATGEPTSGLGGQEPEFSQRYIEMEERMDAQYAEEGPLVDPTLLPWLPGPE